MFVCDRVYRRFLPSIAGTSDTFWRRVFFSDNIFSLVYLDGGAQQAKLPRSSYRHYPYRWLVMTELGIIFSEKYKTFVESSSSRPFCQCHYRPAGFQQVDFDRRAPQRT